LNGPRSARFFNIDQNALKSQTLPAFLAAIGKACEEPADLFGRNKALHRLKRARSTRVGDHSGSFGKQALIGGDNFVVAANDGRNLAIGEIEQSILLSSGGGMKVDHDGLHFARNLFKNSFKGKKRARYVRLLEAALAQERNNPYATYRGIKHLVTAPRRQLGKIGRPEHKVHGGQGRREVFLVVGAVAESDGLQSEFVQIKAVVFAQAETTGSAVATPEDEIRTIFFFYRGQSFAKGENPGFAYQFGYVEHAHRVQRLTDFDSLGKGSIFTRWPVVASPDAERVGAKSGAGMSLPIGHPQEDSMNKDNRFPFMDLNKLLDEVFGQVDSISEKLQTEMEKNFPFHGQGPWGEGLDFYPAYAYPPMNVYLAGDKSLVIEMAMAGFQQEDLNLEFVGDSLLFSAKPQPVAEVEGLRYLKRRLKIKPVEQQKYFVPADKFDQSQVSAVFKNGLLRITVPSRTTVTPKEGVKVNIQG